jgi:DNA-binding NarL/FixJ family response regulator
MHRIRLIVVEGHPAYRETVTRCLSAAGTDLTGEPDIAIVGESVDGADALALCRQLEPDMLISGFAVATIDAITLMGRLRDEQPGVRVVALVPSPHPQYAAAARHAGASATVACEDIADALVPAVRAAFADAPAGAGDRRAI